jgi:hypothetical protein
MRLGGCARPGTVVGVGRLGSSLSGSQGEKIDALTPNMTLKASYYHSTAQLSNAVPIQESTSARPTNKFARRKVYRSGAYIQGLTWYHNI